MKVKNVCAFVCAICVFFLTTSLLFAESESRKTPSAYFPKDQYKFDQVLEGNDVIHDLVVRNKGNALLEIEGIETA